MSRKSDRQDWVEAVGHTWAGQGSGGFILCIFRRDTTEEWEKYNPVLFKREVGIDTLRVKARIGDGESRWLDLPEAPPDVLVEALAAGVMIGKR